MIHPQFILDINDELIVDNFAGGGGASTGIELALGRHVDIAINHDREALAMHEANHPQTKHLAEDIWAVDPVKVTGGRPVGLLWLSPDCKHFSKAKGGKPREKKIRGLALIGLNWVRAKRPRVMILENVEEFQTWGPLLKDGTLNPKCKGRTFKAYVGWLQRRGYDVEWRELRACDYGAPTIRKRLFLIARCDGVPITWPKATHGDPKAPGFKASKLKAWRMSASCIDWSIPCPSIFTRQRPLAEATCRRIAKGIMRYVVNCAEPFVVPLTHHDKSDRVTTMQQPVPTVTAANRGEMALVAPVITEHANASKQRVMPSDEPLRTICAEVKGGHFSLIAPSLVNRHSDHGNDTRADSPAAPMKTITGSGGPAVVSAFLAKHYGGAVGSELEKPIGTVTGVDHHSLVTGSLVGCGGRMGQSRPRGLDEAVQTVTAKGDTALVAATLIEAAHGEIDRHGKRRASGALNIKKPLGTVLASNSAALVRAFLIKYYGCDQDPQMKEPMHTVTARDRFGLVTISGEEYEISDIGLRMLAPRELFKAQGFPDSYIIGDDPAQGLTLTKSAQVRMCGNSVCPPLAEALVRANVPELRIERRAA